MFNSINDAKDFLFTSGYVDVINLDDEKEIIENLYRNANSEDEANEIMESYVV